MTRGPVFGLPPEQVAVLLATAARAPSPHHSRPWRFHVTPRAIELHADPGRRPVTADAAGRELRIACGSALFNLQLAMHGHDIRPIVTILPDRARPGLLAVVRHGGTKGQTPEQRDLLHAVALRRTDRSPFTDAPVDTPALHALRRAALDEGAWLHIVADPAQRAALRALAARADRGHEGWEHEGWEHDGWGRDDVTVDLRTEPVIAVLSSHLSGPSAEIQVGRALERVLLTATTAGLAASFLPHVVEVPDTREELRRLIGGTRPPQAVLRIGHGRPVPASPRRGVVDDLLVAQPPG